MVTTTRGKSSKESYENWISDNDTLDTLWSVKNWRLFQQEAEKQKKLKNKQTKEKSLAVDTSTATSVFSLANDKFLAVENSVDTISDDLTTLKNRISAVESELLNKSNKLRKIKIIIRG